MSRAAYLIASIVLCAASLSAADHYQFHINVTDGRTGLMANPKFKELKISPEQLEHARNDKVIVLDRTEGAHWNWLMLSVLDKDPGVEYRINDRGVAGTPESADIGLTAGKNGNFSIRCLRDSCSIGVTTSGEHEAIVMLKKGESRDLPLDSDLNLAFQNAKMN